MKQFRIKPLQSGGLPHRFGGAAGWYMAVSALLFGLIASWIVPMGDDMNFARVFNEEIANLPVAQSFSNWLNIVSIQLQCCNARSIDKISVLACTIPSWLYGVLFVLTMYGIFRMMITLSASGRDMSSWAKILIVSLTALLLPWIDCPLQRNMYLNYTLPLFLALLWIYTFIRPERKPAKIRRYVGLGLFSLFMGTVHEEIACLLTGFGVLYFIMLRRKDYRRILMTIGVATGLCLSFLPGALGYRAESKLISFDWNYLPTLLRDGAIGFLYLAFFAWLLVRKFLLGKKDSHTPEQWWLMTWAAATIVLIAFVSLRITQPVQRLLWYGIPFAIMGWSLAIGEFRIKSWILKAAAAIFAVINIVSLTAAWLYQIKMSEEYRNVTEAYKKSPDGTVYYDLQPYSLLLNLSMRKCQWDLFICPQIDCYPRYFRDDNADIAVIPTALKGVDLKKAVPDSCEVAMVRGCVVIRRAKWNHGGYGILHYLDSHGREQDGVVYLIPFGTAANYGFAYLHPIPSPWQTCLDIRTPLSLY